MYKYLSWNITLNHRRLPDTHVSVLSEAKSRRLWDAIFRLRGLCALQLGPAYLN